jgi:heme exporter protein B
MSGMLKVLRKDLLIEWRAKTHAVALAAFALTLLLLFSFAAGPTTAILQRHASAYIWMSMLLSSTLLLSRSFAIETESEALENLLLAPVSPAALFLGKAISSTLQMMLLMAVALPVSVVLYDVSLAGSPIELLFSLFLGVAGLAAPGTLYAALTARMHARALMMPLLLFPLVVPCVLAAVKTTSLLLLGDPMDQSGSWMVLQLCFALVYWSLCLVLTSRVIEA